MRPFSISCRGLMLIALGFMTGCGGSSESATTTPAEQLEAAKSMPDAAARATTLIKIAREQQKSGAVAIVKDATYLAKLACPDISDPRRRAEAMTAVAELLLDQGEKNEARSLLRDVERALEEIEDPLERISAVSKVAPTYGTKLNRQSQATEMLDEVCDEIEKIEDPTFRIAAMCDISYAYSELAESDKAKSLLSVAVTYAEELGDARKRCDGLIELAPHQEALEEGSGDAIWSQAEEAAAEIETANSRAFAWVGLVKAYRQAGRDQAASHAMAQAEQAAGEIADQSQKNLVNQELDRLRG